MLSLSCNYYLVENYFLFSHGNQINIDVNIRFGLVSFSYLNQCFVLFYLYGCINLNHERIRQTTDVVNCVLTKFSITPQFNRMAFVK